MNPKPVARGSVYLDALTWEGTPDLVLGRPAEGGTLWRRAWVDATDQTDPHWPEAYRLVQNNGRGLLIQGTHEWANYQVTATIVPHMAAASGIGACVQGLCRYYALLLCNQKTVELVKLKEYKNIDSWYILHSRHTGIPTVLKDCFVSTIRLTNVLRCPSRNIFFVAVDKELPIR